jgi:hypothetical protein
VMTPVGSPRVANRPTCRAETISEEHGPAPAAPA